MTSLAPGVSSTISYRFYRADRAALGPLAAYLEALWAGQVDRLAALAEAAETESGGAPA
jgi:hypothetical protein